MLSLSKHEGLQMTPTEVQEAAELLAAARRHRLRVGHLPGELRPRDEASAYAIQFAAHERLAPDRGARAGWKIGSPMRAPFAISTCQLLRSTGDPSRVSVAVQPKVPASIVEFVPLSFRPMIRLLIMMDRRRNDWLAASQSFCAT